jgi:hypothetical protein
VKDPERAASVEEHKRWARENFADIKSTKKQLDELVSQSDRNA